MGVPEDTRTARLNQSCAWLGVSLLSEGVMRTTVLRPDSGQHLVPGPSQAFKAQILCIAARKRATDDSAHTLMTPCCVVLKALTNGRRGFLAPACLWPAVVFPARRPRQVRRHWPVGDDASK